MSLLRPLPELNSVAEVFWKAAGEDTLLIQKCRNCQNHQHYARPFCLRCESEEVEMVPASGRGKVLSYTVIQRSPYSDLPAPYVVSLVRLEEGVTILSHIVDADPSSIACDKAVAVKFELLRDGVKIPVFTLTPEV